MTNQIIEALKTRRSVRRFADKQIEQAVLQEIIAAGQQAPSSINGQQISLIVIENRATLEQLGDLCGGQPHIKQAAAFMLVVADFKRVQAVVASTGNQIGVTDSVEGLMYGAIDAGITVQALATAAESFGIGTTVIGAIRGQLAAVIDLFNLPKYTVPIIGLAMGYPHPEVTTHRKPRFDMAAYAFTEKYPQEIDFAPFVAAYEQTMREFRVVSGQDDGDYASRIAKYYSSESVKRDNASVYEKQGFKLK